MVAAGNDGRDDTYGTDRYGTMAAPGNHPYVIAVGAMKTNGICTRTEDTIASYSSKGPTLFDHTVKPDIAAPGNRIISSMYPNLTLPDEYPANRGNGYWYTLSGTSMATPVASGAAALLIQQNPSITPDQIKAKLMKTATENFLYGGRSRNGYQLHQLLRHFQNVSGINAAYGSNVVWGSNAVWGATTTDGAEDATLPINGKP